MSYCRSSEKNCDLYCYFDGKNYITSVPYRNFVGSFNNEDYLNYKNYKKNTRPFAGKTFHDPTLECFKETLIGLRKIGYKFPQRVLKQINKDIKNRNSKK